MRRLLLCEAPCKVGLVRFKAITSRQLDVRRRVHENGQRFDAELDTALARGLTRLLMHIPTKLGVAWCCLVALIPAGDCLLLVPEVLFLGEYAS
jgi:hypothetical protein